MTTTAVAPTLEVTSQSARELGYYDGLNALELFRATGVITYPNADAHGIHTSRAQAQYHQGFIRGRIGCSIHDFCPVCHTRHPVDEHKAGVAA